MVIASQDSQFLVHPKVLGAGWERQADGIYEI